MESADSRIAFAKTVQTSKGVALLIDGHLIEVTSSLSQKEQDEIVIALAVAARVSAARQGLNVGGFEHIGSSSESHIEKSNRLMGELKKLPRGKQDEFVSAFCAAIGPQETAITQDVE
jgi:hypothetical protein